MENNKIKVSVFVAAQRFNILTDKSEKYVLDIASEIDARIHSLMISGDMSREKAAVLTAMDYADDSELDKENIAAVKEQIKDYVREIERLSDNNAKLLGDYGRLKEEYERLVAERQSAQDAEKALEEDRRIIAELQEKLKRAEEKAKNAQRRSAETAEQTEEIPLPEKAPPAAEKEITAEDDLFFGPEEEEPVRPEKKKKNRHDHSHVNPYQQKAKEQQQKGYTQQRQYSFFDINDK